MSLSLDPSTRVALVERLRGAGCVFAEDESRVLLAAARSEADLTAMVDRRTAGVPLEYVVGWADFAGLRISVEIGVFVPRRRTELLVSEAVASIRDSADLDGRLAARPTVVVDLCCGSGAVGAAIASALPYIELYAADIDPVAVRCARRNVGARGSVYEGDLYEPLPESLRGHVRVLVANAPYVPSDAVRLMPPEARLFEARAALDGGPDGLDVQRRVVAHAADWLMPGGHLLIETSEAQAADTFEAFVRGGLDARVSRSDEMQSTIVIGSVAPSGNADLIA